MKYSITKTYDIDIPAEKARLKKAFKGKQFKRLLNIVELFEQGKLAEMGKAYDNLPYCNRSECPEQEYMGIWFLVCFGGHYFSECPPTTTMELELDNGTIEKFNSEH